MPVDFHRLKTVEDVCAQLCHALAPASKDDRSIDKLHTTLTHINTIDTKKNKQNSTLIRTWLFYLIDTAFVQRNNSSFLGDINDILTHWHAHLSTFIGLGFVLDSDRVPKFFKILKGEKLNDEPAYPQDFSSIHAADIQQLSQNKFFFDFIKKIAKDTEMINAFFDLSISFGMFIDTISNNKPTKPISDTTRSALNDMLDIFIQITDPCSNQSFPNFHPLIDDVLGGLGYLPTTQMMIKACLPTETIYPALLAHHEKMIAYKQTLNPSTSPEKISEKLSNILKKLKDALTDCHQKTDRQELNTFFLTHIKTFDPEKYEKLSAQNLNEIYRFYFSEIIKIQFGQSDEAIFYINQLELTQLGSNYLPFSTKTLQNMINRLKKELPAAYQKQKPEKEAHATRSTYLQSYTANVSGGIGLVIGMGVSIAMLMLLNPWASLAIGFLIGIYAVITLGSAACGAGVGLGVGRVVHGMG